MENQPCPCGSGRSFGECCGPALAGMPPLTAEALMRSRYTAFVREDADYLVDTWHPGTRPTELSLDRHVRWRGLTILETVGGSAAERKGTVEFRAAWRDGSSSGVLHECSRFVKQSARWWYLDGVLDPAGPTPEPGT